MLYKSNSVSNMESDNPYTLVTIPADILELIFEPLVKTGYRHVFDIHPHINRELLPILNIYNVYNCYPFRKLYYEICNNSRMVAYYCSNYKWFNENIEKYYKRHESIYGNNSHTINSYLDIYKYKFDTKCIFYRNKYLIKYVPYKRLLKYKWYEYLIDTVDIINWSSFETFMEIIKRITNGTHDFGKKTNFNCRLINTRLNSPSISIEELEYYHNKGIILTEYELPKTSFVVNVLIKLHYSMDNVIIDVSTALYADNLLSIEQILMNGYVPTQHLFKMIIKSKLPITPDGIHGYLWNYKLNGIYVCRYDEIDMDIAYYLYKSTTLCTITEEYIIIILLYLAISQAMIDGSYYNKLFYATDKYHCDLYNNLNNNIKDDNNNKKKFLMYLLNDIEKNPELNKIRVHYCEMLGLNDKEYTQCSVKYMPPVCVMTLRLKKYMDDKIYN